MTIYGRSEELVSRCVECDLAEPESLTSLGGSAPGVVDGILSLLDHPDVRDCHDACDPILDLSLVSCLLPFLSPAGTITQQWHADALDALSIMSQTMKHRLPDLDALLPIFGWVSKECIQSSLEKTSQHYKADQRVPMCKHF